MTNTNFIVIISMLWAIVFKVAITTNAIEQYEELSPYFQTISESIIKQYKECTNDTNIIDIDSLLRWKNIINQLTSQPAYNNILKEFILHTGLVDNVYPCQVLNWHMDRMRYQIILENSIQKQTLTKEDETIDSIRIVTETRQNNPSVFDFDSIPFGLSSKVFSALYSRKTNYPLSGNRIVLYSEHFHIGGFPFLLKFYFNGDNRFYKYEIESYPVISDSLNNVTRKQADILTKMVTDLVGPPQNLYRVDLFEISSVKFTPYREWSGKRHEVIIYLHQKKNRYYAKLVVEKKDGFFKEISTPHVE